MVEGTKKVPSVKEKKKIKICPASVYKKNDKMMKRQVVHGRLTKGVRGRHVLFFLKPVLLSILPSSTEAGREQDLGE